VLRIPSAADCASRHAAVTTAIDQTLRGAGFSRAVGESLSQQMAWPAAPMLQIQYDSRRRQVGPECGCVMATTRIFGHSNSRYTGGWTTLEKDVVETGGDAC